MFRCREQKRLCTVQLSDDSTDPVSKEGVKFLPTNARISVASSPKYRWTQLPICWYGGGMEVTGWTGRCDATAHHLHRGVPTQLIPQITGHWSQSGHWTHSRTWTRDGSGGAAAATLRGVRPICGEWRGYAETSAEWPSPLFVFVPLFAGDISSLLATHCITVTEGTPVHTINTLVSTKTFYSAKNLILSSLVHCQKEGGQ